MLERFSDQARQVVVRAGEEARTLNHNWIGTEHLMLGLIAEGSGAAAQVLESLEISLDAARWLVEETVGHIEQARSGQIRFTPRARKVLELASGQSLGDDQVGTQHILLALVQEREGLGAMVLFTLGADQYLVGLRVTQLLNSNHGKEVPGGGSRLDKQAGARLLENPLARVDRLDRRLAAVEHRLGLQPDQDDQGQKTAKVYQETQGLVGALDVEEFEAATGLRDQERQPPASRSPQERRLERVADGHLPLARELGRLNAELARLWAVLRQHGIDPGDTPV